MMKITLFIGESSDRIQPLAWNFISESRKPFFFLGNELVRKKKPLGKKKELERKIRKKKSRKKKEIYERRKKQKSKNNLKSVSDCGVIP